MLNISITNPGKAPKDTAGQMFYLKLQEYGWRINASLNKYGLMDLAKETNDFEFIKSAQTINLVQIVRTANKLTIHF